MTAWLPLELVLIRWTCAHPCRNRAKIKSTLPAVEVREKPLDLDEIVRAVGFILVAQADAFAAACHDVGFHLVKLGMVGKRGVANDGAMGGECELFKSLDPVGG